jgi:hypothetical protein
MNNAGVGLSGSSTWSGRDIWAKILDVNLWGVSFSYFVLLEESLTLMEGYQHAASLHELDDPPGTWFPFGR